MSPESSSDTRTSTEMSLTLQDGRIVEASPLCRNLLLVAGHGHLLDQQADRLWRLDDEVEVRNRLEGRQDNAPWRGELKLHPRYAEGDGGVVVLEGSQSPVEREGRPAVRINLDPVASLSSVLQVTRHRETRLELAIESLQGGFWDVLLDTENPGAPPAAVAISAGLKNLLGYSAEEFPDSLEVYRAQVVAQDRHLMDRAMADHLEQRTDRHDVQYRMRHRDGSIRWLHSTGRVLRDETGRPVRWIGLEQDITRRRLREQELTRTQHRFRTLFRLCPIPIALIAYRSGRVLEVNGTFLRQTGYRRERVEGRDIRDLGLLRDPGQGRRLRSQLGRHGRVERLPAWVITGAGEERAVELTAELLTLEGEVCVLLAGRDITMEVQAEKRLVDRVHRDPLTGLPDRHLCEERLGHALATSRREGIPTAVFFIDLDRLKRINDTLGHRAGDEMLVTAAVRLRQALRSPDLLTRFGGDELVAVAHVENTVEALGIAERLRSRLSEPWDGSGARTRITASIGVAVAGPEAEVTPSDLLRFADVAMYRVKREGGDGVGLFDPHLDLEVIRELETEGDLHLSLQEAQLEIHYQPIVHLDNLDLWGAEALLRWQHPEHGPIAPSRFVPLAETTGLIVPIGQWVLEHACHQVAEWRRQGLIPPDFVISINVSARQLDAGAFADQVAEALRDSGLPAANLQLELTERVALEVTEEVTALEQLGVRLAIDDFGEGYGSLGCLRRFPARALKVEKDFIHDLARNPTDFGLMRSIVYLAANLGQEVIAEGVETPEQLRCLREMGCALGQGFLFAEALPPEALVQVASLRKRESSAA